MKKKGLILIVITLISFAFYKQYFYKENSIQEVFKDKDSIGYISMVDSKYFYIYKNKKWEKEFIKGINIGAGKPGYFPGELGITKEDYLRWFKYIAEMNANTIRVYTILKPDFYNALYEYNKSTNKPLYLLQGVWVNEEDISKYKNAYVPEIKDSFKRDIDTVIDVLHGNKIIKKKPGYAYGVYEKDVSRYVLGYILGIEWDPEFVVTTNAKNKDKINYNGEYLYSKNASPFENFLCEIGDYCIDYETKNYSMQKLVSFTNWPTTDMLSHPNEPLPNEDEVSVNIEHIKKKDTFKTGIFASYHVYPYYPDFMNYQKEYKNFKDEDGNVNTYKAYLKDLKKEHAMPVLMAEFGVPASRGKAHDNIYMGFNQGNISEKIQGEMDASMLKWIYEEGYAGALVFIFQDEYFKRTWNTMDFDLSDRRPYWNNLQTNEQHFGVLAFDPGEKESACYVDGDIKEWEGSIPIYKNKDTQLYMKSDEAYVYFMVKNDKADFNKDKLVIPIDIIGNQGNKNYKKYGIKFNRDADFIISISGKEKSQILVDPYYDSFQYLYGRKLNMTPKVPEYDIKNSGEFVPMYLCLNRELYLPQDKTKVPFGKYETGKLLYGNGNPNNSDYNSLSDFFVKDNVIEIRIPWQLLNVMDPSTKMAMNDLHIDGINPVKIEGIYAGAEIIKDITLDRDIEMNLYTWSSWEMPTYHERLKPSYYILKDAFKLYK